MDRIKQLQMLTRAAELGSFAAAAKELNLTPSAISRGVGLLERELNVTLFNRTTRSLRLTDAGVQVRVRAVELLDRMADLDASVRERNGQVLGVVRIGASAALARHVVMPALPTFIERYPAVRLHFELTQDARSMQASNLDVLLHVGEPPDSRLIASRVAQGKPAVYASPSYIRRHGEPAQPHDLLTHRCMAFRPPWQPHPFTQWSFARGAERQRIAVDPVLVSADREALMTAAIAGAGLIYMASFDPAWIDSGQLRRLLSGWDCEPSFNIYILHRRTRSLPRHVAAFVEFCTSAFACFDPGEKTIVHAGQ